MKIIIDYSSIWQNSVLEEAEITISKRKFKASSKSKEPPDVKKITKNTVLGVLSRLIGDKRKLYQAKASEDFYFKDMEITFNYLKKNTWNETAFLINKSEARPPQSGFIGTLEGNDPLFFSEYAATLWSVLDYDFDELLDFISKTKIRKVNTTTSPTHILNRMLYDISKMDSFQFIKDKIEDVQDKLVKEKNKDKSSEKRINSFVSELEQLEKKSKNKNLIELERKVEFCVKKLEKEFHGTTYSESDGKIKLTKLYVGALNLMLKELKEQHIEIDIFLGKGGGLQGFSKTGFNGVRDFLNSRMGNNKKTTHTPYNLTKSDGQLEIQLDIDLPKAKELKQLIDCAGVSSFYLGKKGLAYVSEIRI